MWTWGLLLLMGLIIVLVVVFVPAGTPSLLLAVIVGVSALLVLEIRIHP